MIPAPSPAATCPAPETGQTALAAALARLRRRGVRTVAFVAALCLAIALVLTAIDGGRFGVKLLYSMCIGAACLSVNDATRLAAAGLTDRLRAARGLPPNPSGYASGWVGVLPSALLAMAIGPAVGQWLADRITGYRSASLLQIGADGTRLTLTLSVLATLASVFVLSILERLADARARAEAAQRLAAETQLALLQSQLEPHMLFNTLANLRVLISMDPPRAQAMLDRLIAFLRTTLRASRQGEHALAAEFEHLADYLALMSMRMGPRLAVRLDLDPALRGLPVPALLLQPLVENAIKHGLEPKVEGGRVEVGAHQNAGGLRLTVRDTGIGLIETAAAAGAHRIGNSFGNSDSSGNSSGFGLAQVRARLTTLYGDRASLALAPADDAEGGVLATLRLPANGAHTRVAGTP